VISTTLPRCQTVARRSFRVQAGVESETLVEGLRGDFCPLLQPKVKG
jgi:hypothetical protein